MTEWQYLLNGSREDAATGEAGLTRLPTGGAVALAEFVTRDGTWLPDDGPWKVKYQGADEDYVEISVDEANQFIALWVQIGRLDRQPDPASSFTDEQRAALIEADRQASARWRAVEMPPGADEISLF